MLLISLAAFTLGFGLWAVFAALGPFLIKWYNFTPSQALLIAAMPPFFASAASIPLGMAADQYGGRAVFSVLLVVLLVPLIAAMFADGYVAFLCIGMLLGLGGASFVVGNAHVSVWYPRSRQGTALGVYALGNFGIVLGMVFVPLLITGVLGGPSGYGDLPPKLSLGPIEGWRLLFLVFAFPTLIMAVVYWTCTSEPRSRAKKLSFGQVARVYTSGYLVWIIAYLYWASFGTLTFFSSFAPTYLVNRWDIPGEEASMIYTSILVTGVALMRPVGGWLSDRHDPRRLLIALFVPKLLLALVLADEISFPIQMAAMIGFAMLSGAAAACVVKLIPTYFAEVGAVSGLAKAAGAACGFVMTTAMAVSQEVTGSYAEGFRLWVLVTLVGIVLLTLERPYRREKA
ncbi:MAG: MFS transporter [Burkholderiales bacterium]|nr:MFS transporter [Burkholderiales bacterium]